MTAAQANAALSTGSSTSGPSLPPSPDVVAIFGPDEGPEWKPLEEVVFEKVPALVRIILSLIAPW